jgi:hypothetical protein
VNHLVSPSMTTGLALAGVLSITALAALGRLTSMEIS